MVVENNLMRQLLRESIDLTRADKYGKFEHSASAISAAGKISRMSQAELRFRLPAGSAPVVATDFTSEFSGGVTPAIAAVRFTDGPSADDGLVLTDEEIVAGMVARPGASGYTAAVSDPLGAGPFDLAEDTDSSDGRFYYAATVTFEVRTIDQSDYLVVTLKNECSEFDFSISEFYFNGPDNVSFDGVVCVSELGFDAAELSEQWDYNLSVQL